MIEEQILVFFLCYVHALFVRISPIEYSVNLLGTKLIDMIIAKINPVAAPFP